MRFFTILAAGCLGASVAIGCGGASSGGQPGSESDDSSGSDANTGPGTDTSSATGSGTDTDETGTEPDDETDVRSIFFEDFKNFDDDWAAHPDWTILDEDGLTDGEYFPPDEGSIWVTPSWMVSRSWACVMSNSRFTEPGQADNWMILPPLELTTGTPYLKWGAQSVANAGNRVEDYEVLISTTDTNPESFTRLGTVHGEGMMETVRAANLEEYAGETVYLAFRHVSFDQYLLRINFIEVSGSAPNDLALTGLDVPDVALSPSTVQIEGTVANKSADPISSFEVNWRANDGEVHTQSISSLDLPPFVGEYAFAHDVALDVAGAELYELEVWVTNPNGQPDGNEDNDAITTSTSGLSYIPEKFVLMEESTGLW